MPFGKSQMFLSNDSFRFTPSINSHKKWTFLYPIGGIHLSITSQWNLQSTDLPTSDSHYVIAGISFFHVYLLFHHYQIWKNQQLVRKNQSFYTVLHL
jgi:hypothetical protein